MSRNLEAAVALWHTLQVMAEESVTDMMDRYSEILDYHNMDESSVTAEADNTWEDAPAQI